MLAKGLGFLSALASVQRPRAGGRMWRTASLLVLHLAYMPRATSMHGRMCTIESAPAEPTVVANDFGADFYSIGSVSVQEGTFPG